MAEGRPHEGLGRVRPFGLRRPEEGPAGRDVAEQLPNLDRRAHGAAVGNHLADPAAVDGERRPGRSGLP